MFHHVALLVALDREHPLVTPAVVVVGNRPLEGGMQALEPVVEDVVEANQQRRGEVAGLQAVEQLHQIDRAAAITAGLHHHVAAGIDREVGIPPAVQAVEIGAAGDRPGLIGSALRHGNDCFFALTIGMMGNAAVLANGVGRHGR